MGASFNVENFVIMQHISFASRNDCKCIFTFDGETIVNIIAAVRYIAFTDRLWQKAKGINRITFIHILGEIRAKDDYGIQTQLTDFMSQFNAVFRPVFEYQEKEGLLQILFRSVAINLLMI